MQTNIYLHFDGQCEEAFKFYEKALGGKIAVMMDHVGTPAAEQAPPEWRKKILHARMSIGDTVLMGGDAPPSRYETPQGFAISLAVDSVAEAERIFKALTEKGTIKMPMEKTFFAERFGMLADRFGTPWMVIHQKTPE